MEVQGRICTPSRYFHYPGKNYWQSFTSLFVRTPRASPSPLARTFPAGLLGEKQSRVSLKLQNVTKAFRELAQEELRKAASELVQLLRDGH